MDGTKRKEMELQLARLQRGYQKRLKECIEKTGMPEHWVRDMVQAQVTIENLRANIAKKMGVSKKDADSLANKVAGDRARDVDNIAEHGIAQWAFARTYMTLSRVESLAQADSPFPAIKVLATAADTLVFAMDFHAQEQRAKNGAKGGRKSAGVTAAVRDEAIRLANEMAPQGGWPSAPRAADEVQPHLMPFAARHGRRPSRRKVEEWLRAAGVKKRRRTQ